MMFSFNIYSQTIYIDSTFTQDGEIFPFSQNDTIYGISVSGSITLFSDTSLVRVILTGTNGEEFMLYEAYPMIVEDSELEIQNECDETCFLTGFMPVSVKIYIINAELYIDQILFEVENIENADSIQSTLKALNEQLKIFNMNQYISYQDWNWTAGQTGVSSLSYFDKKHLFGENYNLLGYDYYIDGIYKDIRNPEIITDNSSLVQSFDWRNKHDADIQGSLYFDDNPDYPQIMNGWMTRVKNQYPCAACTAFGSVAALEAMTNLYFNYHVDAVNDLLLSERDAFNCSQYNSTTTDPGCECEQNWGKLLTYVLNYITGSGIVNEECFPWDPPYCVGQVPDCSFGYTGKCEDPLVTIKPDGQNVYFKKPENTLIGRLKENLMIDGPLICTFSVSSTLSHVVALVGFGIDSENQELFWITKNSYGAYGHSQNSGYWIITHSYLLNHLSGTYYSFFPLIYTYPPNFLSRQKYDKDHDGYWNWGIGEKPEGWTPPCDQPEDWNDNDNRIGPRDENYYGTSVKPEMKVCWYKTDNEPRVYIDNNSFFYFDDAILGNLDDNTFIFRIENPGSAQLNLSPLNTITCNNPDHYRLHTDNLNVSVCMYDGYTEFSVTFNKEPSEHNPIGVIHIDVSHFDDDVLSDFNFAMVYYDCSPASGSEPISQDKTWDGFQLKTKDYYIQPRVTLTVTGNISMAPGADIFVEEGAKLIIDGGRLTGSCNTLWNGIDLWGDPRQPQFDETQGVLHMLNGGMIENAVCGVENCIFDGITYTYTGGIIGTEDAVFKDNLTAVRFWPYHNYNPGTGEPMYNFSRFKNSGFTTTQELYDLGFNTQYFIYMLEVEGVNILGCNFHNELESYELDEGDEPGIGIFSTEADFVVDHYCSEPIFPCPAYNPCRFENLEYGIKASYIRTSESARITNSEFINNITGIYLGVSASPVVTQNIFHVRKAEPVPFYETVYCGLYLDRCTGYQIEENFFYTFLDEQQKEDFVSVGLVVNNSGSDYNEIYNNSFDGLYVGIIAQENNRSSTGEIGLQIKCNDFTNGIYDIAVTKDPQGSGMGIAEEQGSNAPYRTAPAGNIFTFNYPEENPDPEGNYYNICEDIIYWYHSDTNGYYIIPHRHTPEPSIEPKANTHSDIFDSIESCPSNLSGGGPGITIEKANMGIASQQADSVHNLLSILTDGGNTEGLLTEIQTSWPEDAYDLYSELISGSPYLSDTSMIKALEKEDVLLPGMITDVLVANPQSAKSENVMTAVDERINPLSDDQMADIGEGRFIIGAKEALEADYSYYLSLKSRAKNNLIRLYRADTVSVSPTDSIIDILGLQSCITDEYLKAFEYLKKADSANVISTLDYIPLNYDLTISQANEHVLYEDYFEILLSSDTTGSVILNMDSLQKSIIYDIMNNSTGMLQGLARNILMVNDSLEYVEPIFLPQSKLKSGKVRYWPEKRIQSNNFMKIYPNPAKNLVIIEVRLKDEPKDAFIYMIDSRGIIFKSFPINKQFGYLIIPLTDFPVGNIFCQLIIKNKVTETRKLVVVR